MSHSSHETSHGGASHGSVKTYLIGFILSIILTVIPFAMVMSGTASHSTILAVVVGMAVIQVVVHLVYFLHMNTSSEERWNLVALLFTAMIIGIVVVGSLWIMYNLNINMMVD
ncbi:cytochrome o ubiquinol oxidase subunit IV [Serratia proteamaculans]|jgi:cytochrome o ubiquinol oxidase operon protein cyoD|uniref:cytochrome o ubiquinol oxidase subunit IV n=1 Tax=Serratia proteamaculans TaxID=28151 RepID=UPI0009F7F571|nr:cytochrome o ubiquinol oxidase subunit IV [Serratia proteamaculans]CAI0713514.1 Cytochrome o ubiquinol oxidase protein CyoD [Serratia proteamaculans]CAI1513122.1 Cytochrome o ubiquinol oxidase protein CyoD [Serratia proteamaculans]CAI1513434.1 Cytochrome o ubiquinol oxidase protein CyoD [Serratia proteamaculans]CAI1723786.1 Cytochrome o ubiquinol oxidase protein CyoD [Serratia proteamaculans]CAI1869586.1 Cytochrome o ubiquinol oxidase protein CyoD [Serratia proteamaculans]